MVMFKYTFEFPRLINALAICLICLFRTVILNRGPHGPLGGDLQVLGRNTEHLGNWGGMDPFGGNQQIAINSPGCSSGWRIVADRTGHSTQTKVDTGPMKDNIFGSEAFILLTKMEMHALPAQRISKFPSKFGS